MFVTAGDLWCAPLIERSAREPCQTSLQQHVLGAYGRSLAGILQGQLLPAKEFNGGRRGCAALLCCQYVQAVLRATAQMRQESLAAFHIQHCVRGLVACVSTGFLWLDRCKALERKGVAMGAFSGAGLGGPASARAYSGRACWVQSAGCRAVKCSCTGGGGSRSCSCPGCMCSRHARYGSADASVSALGGGGKLLGDARQGVHPDAVFRLKRQLDHLPHAVGACGLQRGGGAGGGGGGGVGGQRARRAVGRRSRRWRRPRGGRRAQPRGLCRRRVHSGGGCTQAADAPGGRDGSCRAPAAPPAWRCS